MDCRSSSEASEAIEHRPGIVVHDKLGADRLGFQQNFVGFDDCSPDRCSSDLIDGRRIKVLHELYSGVYLYL
jgi:hypothetical protein